MFNFLYKNNVLKFHNTCKSIEYDNLMFNQSEKAV